MQQTSKYNSRNKEEEGEEEKKKENRLGETSC
jgi:hypothetical protein